MIAREGGKLEKDIYVVKACVKCYLRQVRAAQAECRALEERIRTHRECLDGMRATAAGRGAGAGADGDALGRGIARLEELEMEWADHVERAAALIAEAYDVCDTSSDLGRHIVWRHEVDGKTWASVAGSVGYSVQSCRRIAEDGYRSLYERLPEEHRRHAFPAAEL